MFDITKIVNYAQEVLPGINIVLGLVDGNFEMSFVYTIKDKCTVGSMCMWSDPEIKLNNMDVILDRVTTCLNHIQIASERYNRT